jgi:hypothetical protein
MELTWRERRMNRFVGVDDHGQDVGQVGLVVSDGGAQRYWHGWRRDGSPMGIDVGGFATAEEAMAAVDAAG